MQKTALPLAATSISGSKLLTQNQEAEEETDSIRSNCKSTENSFMLTKWTALALTRPGPSTPSLNIPNTLETARLSREVMLKKTTLLKFTVRSSTGAFTPLIRTVVTGS